jgi:hypothetical protein
MTTCDAQIYLVHKIIHEQILLGTSADPMGSAGLTGCFFANNNGGLGLYGVVSDSTPQLA